MPKTADTDTATDQNLADGQAGTQTETSAAAPQEPQVYKGKKAEEWHADYVALQNSFNRMKANSDTTGEELKTTKTELETVRNQMDGLSQEHDTLKNTILEINKKLGVPVEGDTFEVNAILEKADQVVTAATDGSKAQKELERAKLLIDEFPDLAPWEKDGLLPSADDQETLRTLFKKFQTNLGTQVSENVTKKIEGASPEDLEVNTTTDTTSGQNEAALIEKMTQIAATVPFDQAAYSSAQSQLDTLLQQKTAK